RASVYHAGEFYDNVFVRDRGGFTSDGYKVDFNPGYHFRWSDDPNAARVDEINLNHNSNFDETRLRAPLAFETFTAAGVPALASFPVRVQQNGNFFKMVTFVENPDEEYLDRVGLDSRGSLYKAAGDHPSMTDTWAYEKKTRRNEGTGDLQGFFEGIHRFGQDKVNFLYDNVDIPAFLSYWAANTIVNDNDNVQKNFYLYRDTMGDREWQFLPWDKDLTFGKHYGIGDYGARDPQTHPFFGDSNHPKIDGAHAWNWLIDSLLDVPEIKQMYLRRLRTLMDDLLQPANTPVDQRKFERRLDELFALANGDANVRSQMPSLRTSLNNIRDRYLQVRRNHLFTNHSTNDAYPDFARIPGAQPARPNVDIVTLDYNPASANQDEEYIQLRNPNPFAVDLSGWTFSNAIDYVLPAGTVIPANGSLYVARDLVAFRARSTGPGGGQRLLAVGGYDGQLSARGETIVLSDPSGVPVETYTYGGAPTTAQQALRVTEVMYHPHDAPNNTPLDENFEYIEVQNVSGQPLNLAGLKLTRGVEMTLGAGTLAPGAYGLIVSNRAAFESRYGAAAAAKVIGQYMLDNLSNGGERIRIEDPSGEVVIDFHFDPAWYGSTDGLGRSLVIRDVNAPIATWGDKPAWRPSGQHGGSPGTDDVADVTIPSGDIVDVAPDPRTTSVDNVTFSFSEPVYGLDLADLVFTRNGAPLTLAAPGHTLSSADGGRTWTLGNLAPLTAPVGRYALSVKSEENGIADYGGNPLPELPTEAWEVAALVPTVVARHVFYNNSFYDGNDAAANAADDGAIDPGKTALFTGEDPGFANLTSYVKGINGIMVDVAGLGATATISAANFRFRVGNLDGVWADAPPPAGVSLRRGAGVAGYDRVTVVWADNAIRNGWLEVKFYADPTSKDPFEPAPFYFGNLVGETGSGTPAAAFFVSPSDFGATRAAVGTTGLSVTNRFDHNKTGFVSPSDLAITRSAIGRQLPPPFATPQSQAALEVADTDDLLA
ncbi:MAG TPA: CotH kinase family protein, partial [Tepidisphaeraceae bacterium]|nr:CotH kinase family protein [Tepidisphaeraceae bacterium]